MTGQAWLLVVIVTVGGAGWVGFRAYWAPLQRCPRCKGTGRGIGARSPEAFNKRCRKCRGPDGKSTGEVVRPMSRFLHRTVGMPIRDRKEK